MKPKRIIPFIITVFILVSFGKPTIVVASDEEPTISSKAAIVIEANTGLIIYSKNKDKQLYPASITKLLTALLVIENLDPSDTLTFSQNAIDSVERGGSSIGIIPGETLSVNDALHGLLLMSANEVANGLAEETSGSIEAFVARMNERAKELHAMNSNFTNPHGLHNPQHVTTVYDMALITMELIKNDYFLSIMKDSLYEIAPTKEMDETRYLYQQHKMVNTKKDMKIYREDVIAGKVGYTRQAGNTLVTVAKQGDRTLIVVLLKSDAASKYPDTASLLDYGFAVDSKPLLEAQKASMLASVKSKEFDKDLILQYDKLGTINPKDSASDLTKSPKPVKKKTYYLWLIPIIALLLIYKLSKRKINRLKRLYRKY
jgi:D-alanyl-D-alanine carboxypeptidase